MALRQRRNVKSWNTRLSGGNNRLIWRAARLIEVIVGGNGSEWREEGSDVEVGVSSYFILAIKVTKYH